MRANVVFPTLKRGHGYGIPDISPLAPCTMEKLVHADNVRSLHVSLLTCCCPERRRGPGYCGKDLAMSYTYARAERNLEQQFYFSVEAGGTVHTIQFAVCHASYPTMGAGEGAKEKDLPCQIAL